MKIIGRKKVAFLIYAEIYLEYSRTNKAPATYWRHDRNNMGNLGRTFGKRRLGDITPLMIEAYKTERLTRVSPATVNRELATLRHMFRKAVEWGYVKASPMTGVGGLKEPPGRVRYLRTEEIERLLFQCAMHIRPIVIAALNTGMRKGEILRLRWRDVDLENRRIVVVNAKNNETRMIPVNQTLFGVLDDLWNGNKGKSRSEFVFTDWAGRPLGDVKKGFVAAVRRAGIADFRFHDLRHTFASHLVMSGVDLRTVQQVLGHTEIKMTLRYAHLSSGHVLKSLERLDKVWRS